MTPAHARIASVIAAALCTAPAVALEGAEAVNIEAQTWPATPRQQAATALDYRLWLGRGRASFGVGVDVPLVDHTEAPPSLLGGSLMIVGMRYRLTDRSRITLDSASWPDGLLAERKLRMGFEFKPVTNPALGLARGSLLRVQWTSRSQLSLRVRGGGLTFAYRSQFY